MFRREVAFLKKLLLAVCPHQEEWQKQIAAALVKGAIGLIALAIASIPLFWSSVRVAITQIAGKAWLFSVTSHELSGWLILFLCANLAFSAIRLILWIRWHLVPSHQRRYRKDCFDGVCWEWKYDRKGKISDLQPFCKICETRLMLSVKWDACDCPTTSAFCTKCNEALGFRNVTKLPQHAELKIEQKIKTGQWEKDESSATGCTQSPATLPKGVV